MPVVVGYRQPAIVLPAYLVDTLDSADIEQVLLHELAHVDRYDDWALLLQRTAESLFAFHPLVQFVGRQINLHREIACDDRVLSSLQLAYPPSQAFVQAGSTAADRKPGAAASAQADPKADSIDSLTITSGHATEFLPLELW